jgi:PAS domain S-box-containing protein
METKVKILVVEDERIVAEDIRTSLKKLGYEVAAVVSTGKEALKIIGRLQPDLILMDVVLRMEMNGIQTAEKIRMQHDVPIIYLTAYADDETLEKAKKTEPYGYILKPFEDRELQTAIEMALYKHHAERRIKENEAWLSTTLSSIADGVIATNEQTKILFMNPAAETITGWKFEEVIGKPFGVVFNVTGGQNRRAVNPVKQVLASKDVVDLSSQARMAHRNGKIIDVDISASPIRNERGRIFGVVMVFQDVTQQKMFEVALKTSEREKRLILSSVSEMVIYLNLDLKVIWANEAAGRFVNQNLDSLKGRFCYEIWHQRRHPCRICPVSEALRRGEAFEMELYVGDDKVWYSRGYPVRNEDGAITGSVEVVRDITEQKRAEEQLEKERNFINTLLQTSPAFYVAIDAEGKTMLMNQTMLASLGYQHEEVIGKNYLDHFVHSMDRKEQARIFRKPVREKAPTFNENRVLTKDGHEIIVEWHGQFVFDKRGRFEYFFGLGINVTERRKTEMEKERIENQLLQIQKMEAIGTLTGGVAHDFNNLLTAIQGCTDMALLRVKPQDAIYRDLKEIQLASNRAADLTRQLLLFSSKHPIRFIPLDLNQTIGDLLKMFHRLIGEDVGISTVLHPALWTISGDKGTIEQVLMNLTVNARDAMPKGGRITIKTENAVIDEQYCRMQPEGRPGEFVRLSVSDTGIGIEPDVMPRIFEPFFSTKGPGKGTGLGLPVVYGIVHQHSGWISVQSTPNMGSTFEVYLPAVKDRVVVRSEVPIDIDGLQGNGERILVVEDAEGIQGFLKAALHENGYMVFLAANARDAQSLFRKHLGRFDLVFSDVVLPDMSGIELIENFLKEKPGLKVLLSSGYTDHKSQWPIIQEKKLSFIRKPFSLVGLLKIINEILKEKSK